MPLIYCVEDDESIRELSYALRGQGYKVEGFGRIRRNQTDFRESAERTNDSLHFR